MKHKDPTHTSLVCEELRRRDFSSEQMLVEARCGTARQVNAALWWLRKAQVVDVVVEASGSGWWFLLPKENDQRVRKVLERVPEGKPRRTRKAAKPHTETKE